MSKKREQRRVEFVAETRTKAKKLFKRFELQNWVKTTRKLMTLLPKNGLFKKWMTALVQISQGIEEATTLPVTDKMRKLTDEVKLPIPERGIKVQLPSGKKRKLAKSAMFGKMYGRRKKAGKKS